MRTAFVTLKSFEVMRMIRRGHYVLTQLGATGEIRLLNQLFRLSGASGKWTCIAKVENSV
jgi:hypothetical protein